MINGYETFVKRLTEIAFRAATFFETLEHY